MYKTTQNEDRLTNSLERELKTTLPPADSLTPQGPWNYVHTHTYTKKHTQMHLPKDGTPWQAADKRCDILTAQGLANYTCTQRNMKWHLPKDGTSWQAADKRCDILTAQGLANYTCTQRNKCHLPKVDSMPSTNRNACNTTPAKFKTSLQATPFQIHIEAWIITVQVDLRFIRLGECVEENHSIRWVTRFADTMVLCLSW